MKVCVIGLGYIGFPTSCVVAKAGHEVVGVDINTEIIDKLNHGKLHIVNEDGLADIAWEVFKSGRLRVTTEPEPADVFILAVPTPYRKTSHRTSNQAPHREVSADTGRISCTGTAATIPPSSSRVVDSSDLCGAEPAREVPGALPSYDGSAGVQENEWAFGADLSFVEAAAQEIVPYLRPGNLVVVESTVPPGTTETLVCRILEEGTHLVCGQDIYVVHAPERVLPGRILKELTENDRIVGGINEESTKRAVAFYRTFVRGQVMGTDATTAEMVKLMENTFRDVNIALANEFALICERLGINVFEAIALANRHPRVKILKPGPGVGGHCIAVDPYFIVEAAPEQAKLIRLARQINSSMPYHVLSLFGEIADEAKRAGVPVGKVVALGASYKPDVGDERESPAVEVANLISAKGYQVFIHDPYIARFNQEPLGELLKGADLLVMLTDHTVYQQELNPVAVKEVMRQPRVLDTRGFFGPEWDKAGFQVVRLGVGRRRS